MFPDTKGNHQIQSARCVDNSVAAELQNTNQRNSGSPRWPTCGIANQIPEALQTGVNSSAISLVDFRETLKLFVVGFDEEDVWESKFHWPSLHDDESAPPMVDPHEVLESLAVDFGGGHLSESDFHCASPPVYEHRSIPFQVAFREASDLLVADFSEDNTCESDVCESKVHRPSLDDEQSALCLVDSHEVLESLAIEFGGGRICESDFIGLRFRCTSTDQYQPKLLSTRLQTCSRVTSARTTPVNRISTELGWTAANSHHPRLGSMQPSC